MSVRAKFKCEQINGSSVTFHAVIDDANKTWAKYTPSALLQMQIDNPDALKAFEVGKHYFLDFTSAPAKEADESK